MYSKDYQCSTPKNPALYRTRRTNNNDTTNRHQEGQACGMPPYVPHTSYFSKTQDTKDKHYTHISAQSSSNTSRNDRKQDHIVQVIFISNCFLCSAVIRPLTPTNQPLFVRTFIPRSHRLWSKVESVLISLWQSILLKSIHLLHILWQTKMLCAKG
jgi:hypothetical protein